MERASVWQGFHATVVTGVFDITGSHSLRDQRRSDQ